MKKLVFAFTLAIVTALCGICAYAGGWQRDNVGWWYSLPSGGYYKNSWFQDSDSKWYYFNQNGYMVTDQWVGDYYLWSDGAMATNKMIGGGYWVGDDGKWDPYTNNLSGLTGKFYFYGAHMVINVSDDDSLRIKGNLIRQSDNVDLGYTEDWIEVTDDSVLYIPKGDGGRHYLTKEEFKSYLVSLADPEVVWLEVYNGKIIDAHIGD